MNMDDKSTIETIDQGLLDFLKNPDSYPHDPGEVTHIQTHISHVFIAGPFVYKIKKPVNLEFLDYSTLEKREHFCRREIELNRRLCEDVYLDVVPVYRDGENFSFDSDDKLTVVEYAVKMKKMPEEHFLHTYINDDTLSRQHLDRVADKLAGFYREQEPDEEILEFGQIKNIKYNTDENFSQTEQFIGKTIDKSSYNAIKFFTNQYYQHYEDLFKRRIEEQRIVDGHGDLHLEHIHITPERVRIYDCIEFNERFRYGDLACDLAYLAMDLDFSGRWKEERYFLGQMAEKLNDRSLGRIIDFYKCYRAYVKGKVKSLQSTEEEIASGDRVKAAETAGRYFNLSLRYALVGSEPFVLICMGQIGTGKSTVAKHLSEKLNTPHFASDRIRKKMMGLPLYERTSPAEREEIYSAEISDKTYRKLFQKAEEEIKSGGSVILDATFSGRKRRADLIRILENLEVNYIFIETRTSDKVIRRRLENRDGNSEVISDARTEDFEKLSRGYNPPGEINQQHLVGVETNQPVSETMENLYMKLIKLHIK